MIDEDIDVWYKYPQYHNMCNKLWLAEKLGYKCGPAGIPVPKDGIYAGPSSFIPYLKDNQIAYIKVEAEGFGGAPVEIDCKLSVQDSPNSAGVVIDAIRFLKVAREMGVVGSLRGPSAWTQKTPPEQMTIEDAKAECDALSERQLTEYTSAQLGS